MPRDPKRPDDKLSVPDQAKLTAILSRLASSFDGERAAAGLLATAFLARHKLGWADLTAAHQPVPPRPASPIDAPAKRDRRRPGNTGWRGYCRRRPLRRGGALDIAA